MWSGRKVRDAHARVDDYVRGAGHHHPGLETISRWEDEGESSVYAQTRQGLSAGNEVSKAECGEGFRSGLCRRICQSPFGNLLLALLIFHARLRAWVWVLLLGDVCSGRSCSGLPC